MSNWTLQADAQFLHCARCTVTECPQDLVAFSQGFVKSEAGEEPLCHKFIGVSFHGSRILSLVLYESRGCKRKHGQSERQAAVLGAFAIFLFAADEETD